jgi:hypothetical protein
MCLLPRAAVTREPTTVADARRGCACCWSAGFFAAHILLSFAQRGCLSMHMHMLAGDGLIHYP